MSSNIRHAVTYFICIKKLENRVLCLNIELFQTEMKCAEHPVRRNMIICSLYSSVLAEKLDKILTYILSNITFSLFISIYYFALSNLKYLLKIKKNIAIRVILLMLTCIIKVKYIPKALICQILHANS